ncbi:ATP-grasp domain-containing protein [Prolixibacteraceae bacterium JC049]|nr:ATP-grasp domain-containing protein [Prolixibacteraceae bacterium JC049]
MRKFQKILVANRGEIAVRIIKTIQNMGMEAIAIYASNDAESLHVQQADFAIDLGNVSLHDTYLNADTIVAIAKKNQCDAIHPGYGFLSENEEFAQKCTDNGIAFIGPSPYSIALMGNKTEARKHVQQLKVPTLTGYSGNKEILKTKAKQLNYPILLKAAAGGGGKGMHIIYSEEELPEKLNQAAREAKAWFNNDELYIESYISNARHIEVQVLGDHFGNIVHLFERECSLQRRYQKVIEEAPSPSITNELREQLTTAAVKIAQSVNYSSAGTIEFLVTDDNRFYFLEMNTRIQVEHPVTEAITGIDLVEQQIKIAQGQQLAFSQENIHINGHAIEARLYAEDPVANYRPTAGTITKVNWPSHIRVDRFFDSPIEISPDYDPMLAKLTAHVENRIDATKTLAQALKQTELHGFQHNQQLLITLLGSKSFCNNDISTQYLEENHTTISNSLLAQRKEAVATAIAGFIAWHFLPKKEEKDLWKKLGAWRTNNETIIQDDAQNSYKIGWKYKQGKAKIEGDICFESDNYQVSDNRVTFLKDSKTTTLYITENTASTIVQVDGISFQLKSNKILDHITISRRDESENESKKQLHSPLFGTILKVLASEGQPLKKGDTVAIIESMKMENNIEMPATGTIKKLSVKAGEKIAANDLILEIA